MAEVEIYTRQLRKDPKYAAYTDEEVAAIAAWLYRIAQQTVINQQIK